MKKIVFISLLIIINYQMNAQKDPYLPMLGDSIEWYFSGEPWVGTASYKPTKDTIINDLNYTKVEDSINLYQFTSYIREDTINRKVYVLSKDSLQERLLYDFDLEQGDSTYLQFAHTDYTLQTGWYTVDTIMNYYYNNTNRKLYYLTCPENPYIPEIEDYPKLYWIEGVGSLIHPIYLDYPNWHVIMHLLCPQHIYSLTLICTFLNGEHIYMHPCWDIAGGDCFSGLKINDNDRTESKGIYPNPVRDISKLDLNQFNDEVKYIQIYNSLGILVKAIAINNKAELTIRKSDFKPGLFFLKITLKNNQSISLKFIIN